METIKSSSLQVTINPMGAEISSIKSASTEYLWQGTAPWWSRRAPILFPIVCSLKNGQYQYNGQTYHMASHGFARNLPFEKVSGSDDCVVFKLTENAETLEKYPFPFVLTAGYQLTDNTLAITNTVTNTGTVDMYFSIGSHEAFNCPFGPGESFEDYYLEFDKVGDYTSQVINKNAELDGATYPVIQNGNILPLAHELFDNDAIVFDNVPATKVQLKSKKSSKVLEMDFGGAPHLGIWQMPGGAPYLCIEPWHGLPDTADHNHKIEDKLGIVKLGVGQDFVWTHAITIRE